MSDLELRLIDLGEHLDAPDGDRLLAAVTARLAPAPRRHRARWLVAAALAMIGGAAVTPAVADWLGTDEVAVTQGPRPDPAPGTREERLDLGRRVSLAEAAAVAGFEPAVPTALGPPEEVWVDDRPATTLVWLRWDDVLLTQLVGHVPDEPVLRKYASGVTVEAVTIRGRRGYWIDGTHEIVVEDHDGDHVVLRSRTTDRTLLVDMVTFTVRIESAGGLGEARRIAESLPGA